MNIELIELTSVNLSIMNLMFLPENNGFFKVGSEGTSSERAKYIEFLFKIKDKGLGVAIVVDGTVAGFIIGGGKLGRVMGGMLPEYQGLGIYAKARNTVIYILNKAGRYYITNGVSERNAKMLKFISKVPHTVEGREYITHFDPSLPLVKFTKSDIKCTPYLDNHEGKLYHLSMDSDLPEVLVPRLPYGSVLGKGKYPEPDIPRVSLSPAMGLCFRAIYPNISGLLELGKEPSITLTLYEATNHTRMDLIPPQRLIAASMVHDAHITMEHWAQSPIRLKSLGKVTIMNTSNDKGLMYQPFLKGKAIYHSPFDIIQK